MFEIGDKVVYPMHGAGVIIAIEKQEFFGKEMEYLVLRIPTGHLRISIPRAKAADIGVRSVCTTEDTKKVLEVLGGEKEDMPTNWNQRYRDNLEKLKTGNIFSVADVVRDLTHLYREKGLSTGEKKMLTNAKNILVSEIIVVENLDSEIVEQEIEDRICNT